MSKISLIDHPKELLELINDCLKPKETEKKQFGEVFTPMKLVNEMLDKLPPEVWKNKNLIWYDPANGMGNFPIAVYLRLMESLKEEITDEKERKKHILEKMLYMSELNKKNCLICSQIFDINGEYKLNLYNGDSLSLDVKKQWNIDKFDVIMGNPPYNKEFKCKNSYAEPLYNIFVSKYIDMCVYLIMITPSRWFNGGKGIEKFTKNMLKRKDIEIINHFSVSSKIFGNTVIIKGGISYFLKNSHYNGFCKFNGNVTDLSKYDIIVDSKYINIINKILQYEKITKFYKSKGNYGISLTDKRLLNESNKNCIRCYVSKIKGYIKYIEKNDKLIKKLGKFKVIVATASTGNNDCFGNMIIGLPEDVHSESYISFEVKTKNEVESLFSYLKCRFTNFLLKLRKITQNISENTVKWIPLVPLDRIWTDNEVNKYFNLTEEEIKLVNETKIIGFK
jgi:site-specific DNA-methyltransferase (adenine-specific)